MCSVFFLWQILKKIFKCFLNIHVNFVGFPIEIPLRKIARNDCFRLRHFIARSCKFNLLYANTKV